MHTYKITYKELNKKTGKMENKEMIITAQHKEYARNEFKKRVGTLPANYRIQELRHY